MCIVITRISMKPASFTASVKRCIGFNQMFVITDVIQASATWNSLGIHEIIIGLSCSMEYLELECPPIIENFCRNYFGSKENIFKVFFPHPIVIVFYSGLSVSSVSSSFDNFRIVLVSPSQYN